MDLNNIITDNLAIEIDLNNVNSWDLNSGLTTYSLTKWKNAKSDNLNLIDFGLTNFDTGRINQMWSGITYTPNDTLFSMYKVGYNIVDNPTSGETTGITVNTNYLPMSGITDVTNGNYFELNGGYLQGFFKLDGYDYELLPSRYNNGITIETLLYLYPDSYGIFYLMGTRAEDKYNPFFSGETISGGTSENIQITSGVFTSEDNYLDAYLPKEINTKSFSNYEEQKTKIVHKQVNNESNINNNIIAFEITPNKKIGYRLINEDGALIKNTSNKTLNPSTGWTLISLTFTPYTKINDPDLLECAEDRLGDLHFYINGRPIWTINNFSEFHFNRLNNDREKQIGVPYNISWGGGSFGLKHSWHYDLQTYNIYTDEKDNYINNNFIVENDDQEIINGLELKSNNIDFTSTVLDIIYTGSTNNEFIVKFDNPITVLSNRDYEINLNLYIDNFFKHYDVNNYLINNKISIIVYGTTDINIIDEIIYESPIKNKKITVGEENEWLSLMSKFRIEDNSGEQQIYIGVKIESDHEPNLNNSIFIKNFTYTGADILVQDPKKNNLMIEQNFDSSINTKLQKLRIYDRGLSSQEILYNALTEMNKNPNLNLKISKGGRIIYR